MSNLEHLIENCLVNIDNNKSYETIMAHLSVDPNLEGSGITADQCWEICSYVYFKWCN